ncbi:GNAT family N-acetyltransferase [Romeria aff. gracilis LEGE 07310]|uniref:GNAT family N-acetyltransferase n=1 Tax=Vasconcelosia minhoensis LEGE 07310 TaxID=915328 RepID=A0A8J7AVZ7_9CYAN|nr:GNAT family N-acetyltransferase [Romeria gracilis]MBE9078078.1 GNAT family N-acetyltransferase [Romeria aff. gracilis LEGE 07310]
MRSAEIVTTYLEMHSRSQLVAAKPSPLTVLEAQIACPEFSRFLYSAVGGQWYWLGRLDWTYQRWLDYLSQESMRTWVGYVGGNPAGFFELSRAEAGDVEIVSLGLLPQFIGQGHGGHLLTCALQKAWDWGAARVWLHTCNLDGAHALGNYQARGLKIYKQTRTQHSLPEQPPGPWPGWQ